MLHQKKTKLSELPMTDCYLAEAHHGSSPEPSHSPAADVLPKVHESTTVLTTCSPIACCNKTSLLLQILVVKSWGNWVSSVDIPNHRWWKDSVYSFISAYEINQMIFKKKSGKKDYKIWLGQQVTEIGKPVVKVFFVPSIFFPNPYLLWFLWLTINAEQQRASQNCLTQAAGPH